jgi:hypothetical protein
MSVARWLLVDEEAASSVSSAVVVNAMAANSPSSACLGICCKSRIRQLWLPGTNASRLFVSSALVSVGGGGMVTLLLLPVVVYILISLLGL